MRNQDKYIQIRSRTKQLDTPVKTEIKSQNFTNSLKMILGYTAARGSTELLIGCLRQVSVNPQYFLIGYYFLFS